MLDKLDLSIRQVSLAIMAFRDTTPYGPGGWASTLAAMDGDYDIDTCEAWKLELVHHVNGSFGVLEVEEPLRTSLFLAEKQLNINEFPETESLEEYPDGIYIVKYDPINGTEILQDSYQTVCLVIAKIRLEKAKLLNKYMKLTYPDQKQRMKQGLSDLQIEIDCCRSLVLVDSYTNAVNSFKRIEGILAELKGEY